MNFEQKDIEALFDEWNRYKMLIKACPHNGFPECILIEIFCDGLNRATQPNVDPMFARAGELMRKTYTQIKDTLDIMSRNHEKLENNNFELHYERRRGNEDEID